VSCVARCQIYFKLFVTGKINYVTLGKARCRWEDNIKMDLQEVGWGAWTGLVWLRIGTGGGLL
jgi:hypothetical protein